MDDRQTIVEGKPLYRIKIAFAGDSGVGKSSLISRFCRQEFSLLTTKTIGVQYATREAETLIKDKESRVVIQCWDTMGERLDSISNLFYKNAVGIILVYDITKRESFQRLQEWYLQIMEKASEFAVLMLLGHKSDLKYLRTVKYEQGLDWARDKEMIFCETSALQSSNVDQSMLGLLQEVMNKINDQPIRTRDTIVVDRPLESKDTMHNSCC